MQVVASWHFRRSRKVVTVGRSYVREVESAWDGVTAMVIVI